MRILAISIALIGWVSPSTHSFGTQRAPCERFEIVDDSQRLQLDLRLERTLDGNFVGTANPAGSNDVWPVTGGVKGRGSLELSFQTDSETVINEYNFAPDKQAFLLKNGSPSKLARSLHSVASCGNDCWKRRAASPEEQNRCVSQYSLFFPGGIPRRESKIATTASYFAGTSETERELSFVSGWGDISRHVISESKFPAFAALVNLTGGRIVEFASAPEQRMVFVLTPKRTIDFFERTLSKSGFEAVRRRNCRIDQGGDEQEYLNRKTSTSIICITNSDGKEIQSSFSLIPIETKWGTKYTIKPVEDNNGLAAGVLFLFKPLKVMHGLSSHASLVKVQFEPGTFIPDAIGSTAGEIRELSNSIRNKLQSFCNKLSQTCVVEANESFAASFTLTAVGNSQNINVFSTDYWWRASVEIVINRERDLQAAARQSDTALINLQDLQLVRWPQSTTPLEASFRNFSLVIENAGAVTADADPLPKLMREIGDRLADNFNGIRLGSAFATDRGRGTAR
jgi:hypothetical protein